LVCRLNGCSADLLKNQTSSLRKENRRMNETATLSSGIPREPTKPSKCPARPKGQLLLSLADLITKARLVSTRCLIGGGRGLIQTFLRSPILVAGTFPSRASFCRVLGCMPSKRAACSVLSSGSNFSIRSPISERLYCVHSRSTR